MIGYIVLGVAVLLFLCGFKVIRPTERGVKETFGKYTGYITSGLKWIIPLVQRIYRVNVTEQIADVEPQEIITKDNLNAKVDLVVFYKVKPDEANIKKAFYNVNDVQSQIVTLAQTTARNVIGDMSFREVNSKRNELNKKLQVIIDKQTDVWGVQIVRVELKEISPPDDVQDTMNQIIKAENTKDAAQDFATAAETEADGVKRASIKEAEGDRQAKILVAEGKAKAFKLINESFKGNAQLDKKLDVTKASLENNSKVILTEKGINPQLIIGEIPLKK